MSSKESPSIPMTDGEEQVSPEFSRRIPLAKLGRPLKERVEATEQERHALAQRFGLVSLSQLVCTFDLKAGQAEIILAEGHLQAQAEQACIITGEPVAETIDDRFSLRFVPAADMPSDEEIDIEALLQEEADDVPYDGRVIDLGEAAAEQLALCLAPYPRREGVGLERYVDVVPSDEELDETAAAERPNPFEALKKLQEKQ